MTKTLVISDNHSPYMHPDALEFISDILVLHPDIKRVIHAGDLIDAHAFSRHEIDPSLLGPKCEIKEAKKQIQELERIIGKREKEIVFGNHCVRVSSRALKAGIPGSFLKNLEDILETSFEFKENIYFKSENLYVVHNGSSKSEALAVRNNVNLICGHLHTSCHIRYEVTFNRRIFVLQTPCLINPASPAFAYNRAGVKRPIIGAAIIENGEPRMVLMPMNRKGRYQPQELVA